MYEVLILTDRIRLQKSAQNLMAISTFSPVGSLSSNGLRMQVFVCVCLCAYTGTVRNELICG